MLDYEGELVVMFDGGYMPPEGLTDAQRAAGETGNEYMAELIAQWEEMHPGIDVVPFGVPEAPARRPDLSDLVHEDRYRRRSRP